MISVFRITAAVLILNISLQSCSQTKSDDDRSHLQETRDPKADSISLVYNPAKGDKRIDAFMKKLHRNRGFNGNVLVAKKGKIIYQNAMGWADYLHRDSLEINSVFELASVSKPFTSTAILMLVEQGKLRLDQNVKQFFPNFPYEGITVELLLTHRSGMMNYVYFVDGLWKKQKKDERKGITNMDVMNLIAEHKPARYSAPDTRFHYNNSNYMVLAAIIEKVTGKSYADFLQENIFKPIGMKNSAVYSKAIYDKIPVDVVGHDRGSWRYSVVQNFLDGPVGDKGVYSTVQDLFLFDRALRDGRLLKKATLDSAYKPHNDMQRGHFNYGYGWRLFIDGDHKVAYHTGWWHGFRHIYLRDLKKDITVILLTNLSNGSLHHLDELYKIVGMPVVRRGAYYGNGETASDD